MVEGATRIEILDCSARGQGRRGRLGVDLLLPRWWRERPCSLRLKQANNIPPVRATKEVQIACVDEIALSGVAF